MEERSDVRHEYVDGFIHALAGETERHNLLVLNIAFLLRAVARGRSCRVVTENVKLHIAAINKIYYPDVMVLCEPGDDHPSIKRRPCFIAEVLSPSTEATDRREKLEAYRMVPGLQTYALVDPHRRYVEVHQNAGGIWRALATQGDGIVVIPCLDASLSLDGLYEGLTPPPD